MSDDKYSYALAVATLDEICTELGKRFPAFALFATRDVTHRKTDVVIRHSGGLTAIGLVEVAVPFLHAAFHEQIQNGLEEDLDEDD